MVYAGWKTGYRLTAELFPNNPPEDAQELTVPPETVNDEAFAASNHAANPCVYSVDKESVDPIFGTALR